MTSILMSPEQFKQMMETKDIDELISTKKDLVEKIEEFKKGGTDPDDYHFSWHKKCLEIVNEILEKKDN